MQVSYAVWDTGNLDGGKQGKGQVCKERESIPKREEIQQVERVFFISGTQFRGF